MRRLQELGAQHPELATPDSPTQRVGGRPREGFLKIEHSSAMLSLDNALNEAELREFDRRVRELLGGEAFCYVAELKMDGLSMAAHYAGGVFAQAVTRGDGRVGEDVTENARTIRSLPLRVKTALPAFEVRGETVMNRRAFERLNAEREDAGLPRFANPRNAAAGSLRLLEPQVTASRRLDYYTYFLLTNGKPARDSHWESLEELARMGFKVNRTPPQCARTSTTCSRSARIGRPTRRAAVRDRRRGGEGGFDRAAAPTRVDGKGAAMGDCLQVPGAAGDDDGRKHRRAGGTDRRADAGGVSRARGRQRRHGLARDASQ